MSSAFENLRAALCGAGSQVRAAPVDRIGDLRRELESLYRRSLIDPGLDEAYLRGSFDWTVAERDPALRSVIIVATPSPQARLVFHHHGRALPLRVGPIYADRVDVLEAVKRMAAAVLGPAGYRTAPVVLPKKPLAVHTGLARYGRNNLVYVPGMGSFHRLTAFASDLPCPEGESWHDLALLDRCRRCTACIRRCPTGAVTREREMVRAERCLSYFNERPPGFPGWIEPGWHHCLVGCMACQLPCPENLAFRGRAEDRGEFSEEETALLLEPSAPEGLPPALAHKLERLGLLRYRAVLPRNLRALLDNLESGRLAPFLS